MDIDLDLLADYAEDHSVFQPLLSNLPSSKLTVPREEHEASNRSHCISDSSSQGMSNSTQAGAVISKIEDIFESLADCLLDEKKQMTIQLKSRPRKAPQSVSVNEDSVTEQKVRNIVFPSRSPQAAWKFTALLRILELSHEALVSGVVTTKRLIASAPATLFQCLSHSNLPIYVCLQLGHSTLTLYRDIYYRDAELFVKQAVVDRYVDDIAFTLGVDRDALNVVAAAKGLVAGSFMLTRKDGSKIDHSVEPEGVLIPSTKEIETIEPSDVHWILIIEKEATFRSLATTQYWRDSLAGKGIMITGKGYPDIQTRQFIHLLSIQNSQIPILALVDFDPDGIGIMSTYKYGSMNLAHEKDLAVPSIRWLGIRSFDFIVPASSNGGSFCDHAHGGSNEVPGLLKLSSRDRRMATRMLEREKGMDGSGFEMQWKRELQLMLMMNIKAEIQVLGNGELLGNWLDAKLRAMIGH